MTLLAARAIRKVYGATVALDGVDFDVHAGAVNVLIGENGAGKSTLMKILAGVIAPTDGESCDNSRAHQGAEGTRTHTHHPMRPLRLL